jgi:hypothetical protein
MPHLGTKSLTIWVMLLIATVGRGQDIVDFQNDVQPILTRHGCTSGPCHGKARGQGGFQLSLLGFDHDFDYNAITKESRGRRLFAAAPTQSLLLTKPTGQLPHGGGIRFQVDSLEYQTILRWINQGVPRRAVGAANLTALVVEPEQVTLQNGATQQLTAIAHYEDGSQRDVTRWCAFQSNESPLAEVDEEGRITAGSITGDTAIMARFMDQIKVCHVTIPRPEPVPAEVYAELPRNNFIDELVWNKLQRLNIVPSPICSDETFLRRVTIDISGRIPTPREVAEFLADDAPDKRQQVVDRLLQEPDCADHWANKWMDLLRPNPYRVGIKTVLSYDRWIRQRFQQRLPWDQLVRELITAQGGTWTNGAVTMYRDRRSPEELTTLVSQLFVGVRLDCAKCHHHVFEKWSQDDFYSFAAYFAKLGRKGTGLSPPISGSEEFIFAGSSGTVTHPVSGAVMQPRPLWGETPPLEQFPDPRQALAQWMTGPENDLFAQVMANRIWADLMGRGLVEPVDDFRATNPASNPALIQALGDYFRDSGFSWPELIRVITASHVYQLDSAINPTNAADTRNYSRHYRTRLRAEVLRDAFTQVSGIEPEFAATPPGATAKQIWTHRTESMFLDAFGRPDPNQDPPCERFDESTVVQSLHLMNSAEIQRDLLNDQGNLAKLAAAELSPQELTDELYRLVYARHPTAAETDLIVGLLAAEQADRRVVIEDVVWAMINSPEFVFQD